MKRNKTLYAFSNANQHATSTTTRDRQDNPNMPEYLPFNHTRAWAKKRRIWGLRTAFALAKPARNLCVSSSQARRSLAASELTICASFTFDTRQDICIVGYVKFNVQCVQFCGNPPKFNQPVSHLNPNIKFEIVMKIGVKVAGCRSKMVEKYYSPYWGLLDILFSCDKLCVLQTW